MKNDPGLIVCEIIRNGEQIAWRGSAISRFWDPEKRNTWQWAYLSLRLTGIFRQNSQMNGCIIKIYYWNKDNGVIELKDFNIRIAEGNRTVYSLIEPLSIKR